MIIRNWKYSVGLFLSIWSIVTYGQRSNSALDKVIAWNNSLVNSFLENKGQVTGSDASQVNFIYKKGNLSIFLLKTGIAYQFHKLHFNDNEAKDKPSDFYNTQRAFEAGKAANKETFRMDMLLKGANPNAKIVVENRSNDYINYYNHRILDVHGYSKIIYKDIYPNIDWAIYESNGYIKYDFIIKPGGRPENIRLQVAHAENVKLKSDGALALGNRIGTITEHAPISYQRGQMVPTRFRIKDKEVSFDVDSYNPDEVLVIDPFVEWATYYGGNMGDAGTSCTTDSSGNVYLAGYTSSHDNIANGGYQDTLNGGLQDAFLVKFNSVGQRLWATYYGGGDGEIGSSCAVDESGSVYLAGLTSSTSGIAYNGHQNIFGGNADAFLVKFDANGTRQWATYYGGSSFDGYVTCSVDKSHKVYLVGSTSSDSGIAWNGYQNSISSFNNGFLVKFDSAGVRQWGTYYGGNDYTDGTCASADTYGNVYLTGRTTSANSISNGGFQDTFGGAIDAYLVKFNNGGQRLWATYYGGNDDDRGLSCKTDQMGAVYLAGQTSSTDNISSGGFQNLSGGNTDAFLAKFDSSGIRQWATYFGGAGYEANIQMDVKDSFVYLVGSTSSGSGIAFHGAQNHLGGGWCDAFLAKFNHYGMRMWSTYAGGGGDDFGLGCIVDNFGTAYLCGQTRSVDHIALNGFQNTYGGGGEGDGFLVKFLECVALDTPFLNITVNPGNNVVNGQSVTFTAVPVNGGSAPVITWFINGYETTDTGLTWTKIAGSFFMDNALIEARLTSNADCVESDTAISNAITLHVQPNGINDSEQPVRFRLYPNPAEHDIYIEGLEPGDRLEIISSLGLVVQKIQVLNHEILQSSLKTLAPGLYLYHFYRGGSHWSTKVIKR